jgi:Stf0 sulphotransferase
MDEVTAHLTPVYPGHAGSAADLLGAAFGRTRFVYLRRGDVVAQAVSLLRAEQTGVWSETADERQEPTAEPSFDFGQSASWSGRSRKTTQRGRRGSPPGASGPTGCSTRTLTTIPSLSPPACSASWGLTCLRAVRSPSGTSASRMISTPSGSQATTFTRRESVHGPEHA